MLFVLLSAISVSGSIWFLNDLESRNLEITRNNSEFISNTLARILLPFPENERKIKLSEALTSLAESKNILALAVCVDEAIIAKTRLFPSDISCKITSRPIFFDYKTNILIRNSLDLQENDNTYELLILFDRGKFIELTSLTIKELLGFFFLIITIAALATFILIRITKNSALRSVTSLIRNRGKSAFVKNEIDRSFVPIMKEVRTLVRELESDKRLRDSREIVWNSKSLKEVLVSRLAGDQVLVVANRQPYIHNKQDDQIIIQTPASGLVTALEPVMRACSGIWFAHGNGNADREVVDEEDKVWVPPSTKEYQIRRIWLTEEEEKGFYYGFANQGLWPLCHIAHIRPIFRLSDFEQYRAVNQKFADAIIGSAHRPDPIILVQDYHFALLPRMIRKELPKATIITFWHIPWPNAEKFGITPWVEEILDGMLGSSVLGFHTKYHCYNFLQTVDRYFESRINWERSTVSHNTEMTVVRQYPISIEFPPKELARVQPIE
ncbi:MAG TPA: trehalose-6-phosphate synthase, partial [Oligoflexia bacterium]|nr:trehalose-6-phosphate synthase [Oligoflexia bacterium]